MKSYRQALEARRSESKFANIDKNAVVSELRNNGIAFGLKIEREIVDRIIAWAEMNPCYADRNADHGFMPQEHHAAGATLGKPILLAQYFNVLPNCKEVAELADDPVLLSIAAEYLGSIPAFVGANLWWTFPVDPLATDREKHAHVFHRDVDDFKFFKFFFYLTDVNPGEGAHVAVLGSHNRPPSIRALDPWLIRRYSDAEIQHSFLADNILEICGDAGTGFAEDTLCIHKGSTPKTEPRLLLQLQFALFDHGVMHDRRNHEVLRQIEIS